MKASTWMSWSSGKDSAFALHQLTQDPSIDVTGLLTTVSEAYDRVSMHGVRTELLELQARALGLPLWTARIPTPCPNQVYAEKMEALMKIARETGVRHIAFGDLFLEDIRAYREEKMQGTGLGSLFPLWKRSTQPLAHEMIRCGLRAILTCVDLGKLDASFAGRRFDAQLLRDLPGHVDPCGENGEFHTFVYEGPMFKRSIPIAVGERTERDGFMFCDVRPA